MWTPFWSSQEDRRRHFCPVFLGMHVCHNGLISTTPKNGSILMKFWTDADVGNRKMWFDFEIKHQKIGIENVIRCFHCCLSFISIVYCLCNSCKMERFPMVNVHILQPSTRTPHPLPFLPFIKRNMDMFQSSFEADGDTSKWKNRRVEEKCCHTG